MKKGKGTISLILFIVMWIFWVIFLGPIFGIIMALLFSIGIAIFKGTSVTVDNKLKSDKYLATKYDEQNRK